MIFSETGDLPGNVLMEQAVRAEMQAHSPNGIEFFTESLDASRFPNPKNYQFFKDYLKDKYTGQNLDLVMAFMSRDYALAGELSSSVLSNLPVVFVAVNELDLPETPGPPPSAGIVQHFDIQGTLKFIFQLQPETRGVVVVGGADKSDQATLDRIRQAAGAAEGVQFEFWTNRPMGEIQSAVAALPADTVVLLSTVHRDLAGQTYYTAQVGQMLAPSANVPVYVLGGGSIGGGALGGSVVDFEKLGTRAGELAVQVLNGPVLGPIPVEVRTRGTPTVDWRALERWNIKPGRLPADCVIRYRPNSMWAEHEALILFAGVVLLAQALTIAALLVQRGQQRRAEAEILRQRTELAHVTRVSTVGQLASALTHELNQPLGAILRNAEAAEILLQGGQPDLEEVRAILADIRKDDKRAGDVIDRMRTLFRRRMLESGSLDLRELVGDTAALARPDAVSRRVKLTVQLPPQLPAAQGDRVYVQQVLLNLVLNGLDALNAVPEGRRLLVVRVVETKNGNLRVAVTDNGPGIAPDDVGRLFEPFFTTKPAGMGMGLAISRTIIEALGGHIWMEPNTPEGTTFAFLLPRTGTNKAADGDLPPAV
jgi:signal transduction histidine kinase